MEKETSDGGEDGSADTQKEDESYTGKDTSPESLGDLKSATVEAKTVSTFAAAGVGVIVRVGGVWEIRGKIAIKISA